MMKELATTHCKSYSQGEGGVTLDYIQVNMNYDAMMKVFFEYKTK